jgi:hypothetical protein
VIIDAIHKCNAYTAKKARKTDASEMRDGDTTGQQQQNPIIIPHDHSISLDHILSNIPYKDMLQDLFGLNAGDSRRGTSPLSIPVVTKSYEESFMREPMYESERACVMGTNCECNFIGSAPGHGFISVEFTLPSEDCLQVSERARQMCVLCHRRLVQSLFYDIVYSGGFPQVSCACEKCIPP